MKTCVVIGDPIEHSLSPCMHNAGYVALGIERTYHYIARRVQASELAGVIGGVRASDIRGISCTTPHKMAIIDLLDEIDGVAVEIGAINTVVNEGGVLRGYNTDWLGAIGPLEMLISLNGKRVALLGAGGAARAVAYGIARRGCLLTIYNRTEEKARALAEEFGGIGHSLEELGEVEQADVIVNTISLGLRFGEAATLLPKEHIREGQIVFDAVYTSHETSLLRDARERGAQIVHGIEFLLHQGMEQFRLYTGYAAPENAMRKALQNAIAGRRE